MAGGEESSEGYRSNRKYRESKANNANTRIHSHYWMEISIIREHSYEGTKFSKKNLQQMQDSEASGENLCDLYESEA